MAVTTGDPSPEELEGIELQHENAEGGHHETREQRHVKEHLATWIFIGGDAIFLALEIFSWFYLKALNTSGMWRCAACTKANPGTDGLGNPITQEITKANPAYTLSIAGLVIVAALLFWGVESAARRREARATIALWGAAAALFLLAAAALQSYQFTTLPFSTIDGSYASCFTFFMGSTLAHVLLLSFIGIGVWSRSRLGRYDEGHWYQVRIVRIFAVWIAVSTSILAIVMVGFA